MQCDYHEPYEPKRILAVGAHPDDIDFGASGSLIGWALAGAHIEYVIITDGSKGSADLKLTSPELIKLRQQEQRRAANIVGAKQVHFLGYSDGYLEVTMQLKSDLVRLIRSVRPDTVIVMDPTFIFSTERGFINHPDHRAAGQATLDAIFPLARDHLSFPELYAEGLEPHKVEHVLLTNFEGSNCCVDISDVFDTKVKALLAHASQIPDTNQVKKFLRERAAAVGQKSNFELAEGFVRVDPPK